MTVFLLLISVIFGFGGDAPSLFGMNVYVVRTDAFDVIKNGSAVMTSRVPSEKLSPGNIVIYKNSDNRMGLAEIRFAEVRDNVYSYSAMSERGSELTLSEGQIVGKAMQYSDFLGALIRFAKSTVGVAVIAVLPCLSLLILEASRGLRARYAPPKESKVDAVKKQDEIPTFVPRPKAAIKAYSDAQNGVPGNAAAVSKGDYPLFLLGQADAASEKKPLTETERRALEAAKRIKQRPVSQKRLNEVIEQTKNKGVKTVTTVLDVVKPAPAPAPPPVSPPLSALEDAPDAPFAGMEQILSNIAPEAFEAEPAAETLAESAPQRGLFGVRNPRPKPAPPASQKPTVDRASLAARILEQDDDENDKAELAAAPPMAEIPARTAVPRAPLTAPQRPGLSNNPVTSNTPPPRPAPFRPTAGGTAAIARPTVSARPAVPVRPGTDRLSTADALRDETDPKYNLDNILAGLDRKN